MTAGATATGTVTYAGAPLVLGVQEMWPGANLGDVVYLASPPGDARIFVVDQQEPRFLDSGIEADRAVQGRRRLLIGGRGRGGPR